ncbi:MAG: preprotein translocase subunit SecG [candidate division Zixibacteria bacterium]|nr:preprotein translocase subunit SecG [candidate division Zixibacteria bacterium]
MFVALIVVHVIICVALILVVLMQSSKGEGLAGSAFGGGLSSAVFGGRGAATFLSKATTVLAVAFMVMCIFLSVMSAQDRAGVTGVPAEGAESAVTRQAQEEQQRQQQQQGTGQNPGGLPTEGSGGTQTPPTTPPSGGGQ